MTDQPKCNWRDFITATDETPANVIAAFDRHFGQFLPPNTDCPGCGRQVFASANDFAGLLTSTFRWGLVHGHGQCGHCGWPAVLYHSIPDDDGKELAMLRNVGLVVHPDFVKSEMEDA